MSRPPRQTDRAFGLTFAALFAALFAVGLFVFGVRIDWAVWTAAVFAFVALAVPGALLPFNRLWQWFGAQIGRVTNLLLLGAFLYAVITPIGLLLRVFGYDPMARRIARSGSYWTPVRRTTSPETLRDMF